MSDLRTLLMRLDDDLDGLPRPDPVALRGGMRQPRHRWWLLPAALATAAVVGVTAVVMSAPRGNDVLQQGSNPASPPATASPAPSVAQSAETERPWLPPPWMRQSATGPAPVDASQPEYLFCDWPVPPSQVINGDRTAVSEQVFVHPTGLRARLIRFETDTPGGVSNLLKLSYSSCVGPGQAEGHPGPRNLWVYRGVAGGADLGSTRGRVPQAVAQVMHVVEISSESAERPAARDDAAAVLDEWARAD